MNNSEFFRQATKLITGTLDIEVALDNTLPFLRQYMPIDNMVLTVLNFSTGTAQGIAVAPSGQSIGNMPDISRNAIIPLPPAALNSYTKTLLERKESFVLVMNTLQEAIQLMEINSLDEIENSFAHEYMLRPSKMLLALTIDGKNVAFLVLLADGEHRYTNEQADLILSLNEPFAIAVANALTYHEVTRLKALLEDDKQFLQRELSRSVSTTGIVGANTGLRNIFKMVDLVSPTDSPVLLLGETGTGKELIANIVHERSSRRNGPFIKVNCGAIPDGLVDSELFGHEKGAFTGAIFQKRGRFERANGGTLFLDEVAELTPSAQVKLLRVLQHKEFERVGGTEMIRSDARIIAATNRDMTQMIKEKKFREDLWFRLNVFPIHIPPLRQRKEDLPQLVRFLIEKKAIELKIFPTPQPIPGVLSRLTSWDWPGNVRELENLIERELILSKNDRVLRFDQLYITGEKPSAPFPVTTEENMAASSLDDIMVEHIRKALSQTNGRIHGPNGAAKILSINPSTLRSRMRKYGIKFKKQRI